MCYWIDVIIIEYERSMINAVEEMSDDREILPKSNLFSAYDFSVITENCTGDIFDIKTCIEYILKEKRLYNRSHFKI